MKNPGIRVGNLVAAHLGRRDDTDASEKQCDLSWVQKFQLYTEAMIQDELDIAFDPVPFSQRARVFLQDIRDMCKRDAPDVYRAELFAKDEELGDFLGAMLAMPWQNNRTWAKACEMLKELIEEYGGTELLRAKERVGLETAGPTDDKREMGLGEVLNLTKGEEAVEKVTEKLYTSDKGQEKEIQFIGENVGWAHTMQRRRKGSNSTEDEVGTPHLGTAEVHRLLQESFV
jgi:hypothetical protein